jgi:two-component system chemotaxis sensor kinase CheA
VSEFMLDAADREELLAAFVTEADETLERFEELLLQLERSPDDDALLHEIFRAAHTLKGSASCLQLDELTAVAHAAEELLDRLRSGATLVSPACITQLLDSADVMRRLAGNAGLKSGPLNADVAMKSGPDVSEAGLKPAVISLRVGIDKLDRMLDLSGEITIARGQVRQLARTAGSEEILDAVRDLDRLSFDLQELIMSARLVPLGHSLRPFHRIVRDVAAANRKRVVLLVETGDVEVDTTVVEQLKDPITHMIRNAVDHGIELPDERAAAGKPPSGTIRIAAAHEAGGIVLRFSDDGAGLQERRIAARGRALGHDVDRLSRAELFALIFEPGFSTAREVTEVSGRGVGMDIVRRNIETLRGSISVSAEPGAGTTFTIRLPLTVAVIDGFGVAVGGETYVLPVDTIIECTEMPAGSGEELRGVLDMRGQALPYLRLRNLFAIDGARPARENVVVVQHGEGLAGIVVDELLGGSPTVMKPLSGLLRGVPGIAGSSILGNGRVALVLDTHEVVRRAAEPVECLG